MACHKLFVRITGFVLPLCAAFLLMGNPAPAAGSTYQTSGSSSTVAPINAQVSSTGSSSPSVAPIDAQISGAGAQVQPMTMQTSGSSPSVAPINAQISGAGAQVQPVTMQTSGSSPSIAPINAQISGAGAQVQPVTMQVGDSSGSVSAPTVAAYSASDFFPDTRQIRPESLYKFNPADVDTDTGELLWSAEAADLLHNIPGTDTPIPKQGDPGMAEEDSRLLKTRVLIGERQKYQFSIQTGNLDPSLRVPTAEEFLTLMRDTGFASEEDTQKILALIKDRLPTLYGPAQNPLSQEEFYNTLAANLAPDEAQALSKLIYSLYNKDEIKLPPPQKIAEPPPKTGGYPETPPMVDAGVIDTGVRATCSGDAAGGEGEGEGEGEGTAGGAAGGASGQPQAGGTPGGSQDGQNIDLSEEFQKEMEQQLQWEGPQSGGSDTTEGGNQNNPTGLTTRDYTGDPVIMPTGNLHDKHTDLRRVGGSPALELTRSYNSMATWEKGPLGNGWRLNWDIALEEAKDGMWVIFGDGFRIFYRFVNDHYEAPRGSHFKLEFTDKDHYTLTSPQGEVYTFDDPYHKKVTAYQGLGTDKLRFSYLPLTDLLKKIEDPFGNAITFSYDIHEKIVAASDSSGRKILYQYNAKGMLRSVKDFAGHEIRYEYDAAGNLVYKTQSDGVEVITRFDDKHRVQAQGDQRAPDLFRFTYDDAARITRASRGKDTIAYQYDENRRITRQTLADGSFVANEYDEEGNLTGVTKGGPGVAPVKTSYRYDAAGNMTQIADPMGNKTAFQYDTAINKMTAATDPLGHTIRYTYDAQGKLSAMTDALGNTTHYQLNQYNQPLRVDYPDGTFKRFEYSERGYLIKVFRGVDQKQTLLVTYTYDNAGNIRSQTDVSGKQTEYTYDADGHVSTVIARSEATKQSRNLTASYTYDSSGHITAIKDPKGRVTRFTYWPDWYGSLKTVTDPFGKTTAFDVDAYGRRTKITSANRKTIELTYNAQNRPTEILKNGQVIEQRTYDAFGNLGTRTNYEVIGTCPQITRFSYDPLNRLIKSTDPQNNTIDFVRDAAGNIVTRKDPNGTVTQFQYNAAGLPIKKTDALGNTQTYEWDSMGRLASTSDPLGAKTTFRRNVADDSVAITDPEGATTRYQYDEAGNIQSVRAPDGGQSLYQWDSLGHLTQTTDPLGAKTRYAYDITGNITKIVDPLGRAQNIVYDEKGRPTQWELALGDEKISRRMQYNEDGTIVTQSDSLGHATTISRDDEGRIRQIQNAMGQITRMHYDARDQIFALEDAMDRKTVYERDAAGRVIALTDPAGNKTQYRYDKLGNLIETQDAAGNKTTLGYDPLNRLSWVKSPTGALTRYQYDPCGRIKTIVSPLASQTTFEYNKSGKMTAQLRGPPDAQVKTLYRYDNAGRVIAVTGPDGNTSAFDYDANGRLTRRTNTLNAMTQFQYDQAGRLLERIAPDGGKYSYAYTLADKISAITDPLGSKTQYSYDAAGNLIEQMDALNRKTAFQYDPLGRLTGKTDAKGEAFAYQYNAAGQIVKILNPDKTEISYAYDSLGRLLAAQNADGYKTSFQYDALGRAIEEINTPPGGRPLLRRNGYDALGRRTSTQLGDDAPTTYRYDELGRPIVIASSSQTGEAISAHFTYDSFGRRKEMLLPNGIETNYSYDPAGRIKEISSATAQAEILQKISYDYDAAGNPVKKRQIQQDPQNPAQYLEQLTNYSYDKNSRLIEEVMQAGNASATNKYNYDAAGNRISQEQGAATTKYSYNPAHELTGEESSSGGGKNYSYDALGNLVVAQFIGPRPESQHFIYNPQGLLSSVENASQTTNYSYDALGRRITKGNTNYIYDGLNIVKEVCHPERSEGSPTETTFIPGPRTDEILGAATNTEQNFFLSDALGTITAVTDPTQKLKETFNYDAFGNARHCEGQAERGRNDHEAIPSPIPQIFAGHPLDPATGMYNARARNYDPTIGRFSTQDPLSRLPMPAIQSIAGNPYVYVKNVPTKFTDPLGLYEQPSANSFDPYNGYTDPSPFNFGGMGSDVSVSVRFDTSTDALGTQYSRQTRLDTPYGYVTTNDQWSQPNSSNPLNLLSSSMEVNLQGLQGILTAKTLTDELARSIRGQAMYMPDNGKYSTTFEGLQSRNLLERVVDRINVPGSTIDQYLPIIYDEWNRQPIYDFTPTGRMSGTASEVNELMSIVQMSNTGRLPSTLISPNDLPLETPFLDPIDILSGFAGPMIAGSLLARAGENALAEGLGVAARGTTVIGHLPDYVNIAENMGANYLKQTPNWNWSMQGDFIKDVIQRGDNVFIGTPIREGASVLKHEIMQLIKGGYKPAKTGSRWLIKGAE